MTNNPIPGPATASHGARLRQELRQRNIVPFIGVYDVFSAAIAGRHFDGIFISGFSFAASHYGLPDRGFITWSDIANFTHRVRTILPQHHIIVDIDDGYCDAEVACHAVSVLEALGASGVILEDQQRPRRCGHFDGKQIMPLDAYLDKLGRILATRRDLFVVARTDASDIEDITRRVMAFAAAGADAVLVDAVRDLSLISELRAKLPCLLMFNQIDGGKSPPHSLGELQAAGIALVNYSTPCLFAAQEGVEEAMLALKATGGKLARHVHANILSCTRLLDENVSRRDCHEDNFMRPSSGTARG